MLFSIDLKCCATLVCLILITHLLERKVSVSQSSILFFTLEIHTTGLSSAVNVDSSAVLSAPPQYQNDRKTLTHTEPHFIFILVQAESPPGHSWTNLTLSCLLPYKYVCRHTHVFYIYTGTM